MRANNRKVLVIGWDAADWKVINALIEQNKMPHTAALLSTREQDPADSGWSNPLTKR